ncbi:hypothetical protein MKW94_003165 [Papaver nudicaule]|uniref:NAC domain-containing protein n=1 Tax=Papaver nudicaule TaxID=74823 RepID=A0AA41SEZ8_PAPNU|nr:hypothetical protein [Papaver nudicaule]MCL7044396.1 hypothetical protein [Papaver nudicaule]
MGDQNLEDSYVPIGFKFAPSDDELISFFLKNKIANPLEYNLPKIPETNIYAHLPQELLDGNKDKDAYFFTLRNKRHVKGSYVNRSVKEGSGHWRISGSNEINGVDGSVIGHKNNLKFYTGKNRKECKGTDWLMNEFVMAEKVGCNSSSSMKPDDWAICHVYLKKELTKKIEKERKRGRGHEGIKTGDHEIVRMSLDVPRPVHHQEHEDQLTSYNPQFGANNLPYSEMSSNKFCLELTTCRIVKCPPMPYHIYHMENHYQFGDFSRMNHQHYYQQQPCQNSLSSIRNNQQKHFDWRSATAASTV